MSEPVAADRIARDRRRLLGSGLSLHYRRPLHIVRGRMQHLWDADGRAYLDAVNNVAHVGHQHPRVVEALRDQAGVLNTNTRYLHEGLIRYAERLVATFPDPLRVCWFVNSGSEANELALRLARAHTGRRGVVVLEGAYHGNTSSLIEMSPYKYTGGERRGPNGGASGGGGREGDPAGGGPRGGGRPEHVQVAPLPDPWRQPEPGAEGFAAGVGGALERAEASGYPPAAFFVEPLPGCAGQIVPPAGYLARAFRRAREAGAVCVADEVQTGLGRVGSHFWAFEADGRRGSPGGPDAVPDIVTMGKPLGNGHPLGAVVATREVAESFGRGPEYFNTFGGNPVSMAVGLAVLDVIRDEGLQEHAEGVGSELLEGLRDLAGRHPLVGDVRGRGLYLGVELVLDRDRRTPAPQAALEAAERMRDEGILVGTDGIHGNVIKLKPPLPFTAADGERLVEALDRVLSAVEPAGPGGAARGAPGGRRPGPDGAPD